MDICDADPFKTLDRFAAVRGVGTPTRRDQLSNRPANFARLGPRRIGHLMRADQRQRGRQRNHEKDSQSLHLACQSRVFQIRHAGLVRTPLRA